MSTALRWCAIVTGSVASVCVAISLTWWLYPSFGYRTGYAVLFIAFMTGLLGWFAMVGLLFERALGSGRRPRRSIADVFVVVSAVWKAVSWRLFVWLALIVAAAGVSAKIASKRQGKWSSDTPYGWRHCHWPLTANHDTEHLCVSHARWLDVNLLTSHIFVGFGAIACCIVCIAFITLARTPRPMRQPEPWLGGELNRN